MFCKSYLLIGLDVHGYDTLSKKNAGMHGGLSDPPCKFQMFLSVN